MSTELRTYSEYLNLYLKLCEEKVKDDARYSNNPLSGVYIDTEYKQFVTCSLAPCSLQIHLLSR